MKKIIRIGMTVLLIVLGATGCNKNKAHFYYLQSFIPDYYQAPVFLTAKKAVCSEQIWVHYLFDINHLRHEEYYSAPGFGFHGHEKFREIAERNGDVSYNRKETIDDFASRWAYADNFSTVRLSCRNADWDERHPAGEPLNDLATIRYTTYAPYIRSGYTQLPPRVRIEKAVTELTETEMAMFDTIDFMIDPPSSPGTYEIEVLFVTTEGVEKTEVCTLEYD